MTMRLIVSAVSSSDLLRLAENAREIVGPDGVVDAVVLAGDRGLLAPNDGEVDDVSRLLAGRADRVICYGSADAWLRGETWTAALRDACGQDVTAVFLGDSPVSREAAGRLAVSLNAACASMVDQVRFEPDGGLAIERSVYGGVADGTVRLTGAPSVCLFASKKCECDPLAGAAPVETRQIDGISSAVEVISEEPVEKTVDLSKAQVVVGVGRGFSKAEDLKLIDPLLSSLQAELGCSRPISEDFKWLPMERQVGLTGETIAPDLYIAVGISGQVQHLAGIKGVRVVVAVNNDPKAPIVRNADYTVLGDLYKVIPALVEALSVTSKAM